MNSPQTAFAVALIVVAYGIAARIDHDDESRLAAAAAPLRLHLAYRDAEAPDGDEPSLVAPRRLLTSGFTERTTTLTCVVVER